MIDSFSERTEEPTDFSKIFRRLELYLPYFNTSLLYGNQQTKIGEVRLIKKGQGRVLASGSVGRKRLHFAHYCSDSGPEFTPVQTLVLNQCNMLAPYWDICSFTFLQWKRVRVSRLRVMRVMSVRHLFFLLSMVLICSLLVQFYCILFLTV